eukprot:57245_1
MSFLLWFTSILIVIRLCVSNSVDLPIQITAGSVITNDHDNALILSQSSCSMHANNDNTDTVLTELNEDELTVSPTLIGLEGTYNIDIIYTIEGERVNMVLYAFGHLYHECVALDEAKWSISMFEDFSIQCNYDNINNDALLTLTRESIIEYNDQLINKRDHLYQEILENNIEIHNWEDLFSGSYIAT